MADVSAGPKRLGEGPSSVQFAQLAKQAPFRHLLHERSRFVIAASVFLLVFNLLQPVLSVFTTILDGPAVGALSWGWVYAFAQFVVPLLVLHLYTARAQRFDAASALIVSQLPATER